MEENVCIKIWMGNNVPMQFRQAEGLRNFTQLADNDEVLEYNGMIIMFVAHVPAAVLTSRVYQEGNWPTETAGWIREGELGLFGTNALNIYPHPDGDGVLVVGSAV